MYMRGYTVCGMCIYIIIYNMLYVGGVGGSNMTQVCAVCEGATEHVCIVCNSLWVPTGFE